MPQATFVSKGTCIDYTPGSAVAAGDVVVIVDLVAVAPVAIEANKLGSLQVEGVWDFTKAAGSSTAIPAGTLVYWDDAENVAKADAESGANKLIGVVAKAAVDADVLVRVLMKQT